MSQAQNVVSNVSERISESRPDDIDKVYSFFEYIDMLIERPEIGRNAYQRLADMFSYYGTEYDDDLGITKYKMVTEDPLDNGENIFYGRSIHLAIHSFVNKIESGARGLGPERRILLLLGPVGSGKSDFESRVRRYFEHYTRTEEGAMYTFRWVDLCSVIEDQDPVDDVVQSRMNQDPLVLIPEEQRGDILEKMNENLDKRYNIRNDQSLDPESEFYMDKLMTHYDGDFEAVVENHIEVVRLEADESKRQCIETFEPKDKKNQDESELTGDINYSKMAIYSESDPRAFDYSGAFCNANRGIFSSEETFKLQREFLYDFLHATQERTIKPRLNPRMDIDLVIIGRTNMPEYRDKKNDDKMEAFLDRTKRIDFPYVLEYDSEAKIYEKVMRNADIPDIHTEPHTREMTALFTVLTRMEEIEGIDLIQKAKIYNGSEDGIDDYDIDKLTSESPDDGMFGLSPRFTGDEIAEAIVDVAEEDSNSLSPLRIFSYLEEDLELHGSIDEEQVEEYQNLLSRVREEYRKRAIEDVRHAIAYDVEEIKRQGEKYLDHVMAWIQDDTVEDEMGHEEQPDETFMRAVEEKLSVPEDRKENFRHEISNWISERAREGQSFEPSDNERLLRALERKNWEDKKHNINFNALVSKSDDDERSKWIDTLRDEGYSEEGAKEVLEFAGAAVAKAELEEDSE